MNRNISKTNGNRFFRIRNEVYNVIHFFNQVINLNLKMNKSYLISLQG